MGGGWGGIASQIMRSEAPNWSSARSNVCIRNLLKIYVFLYYLFYNVTVSTLNYIPCLLKIYATFIASDSHASLSRTTAGAAGSCTQTSNKNSICIGCFVIMFWTFVKHYFYFLLFLWENVLQSSHFLLVKLRCAGNSSTRLDILNACIHDE